MQAEHCWEGVDDFAVGRGHPGRHLLQFYRARIEKRRGPRMCRDVSKHAETFPGPNPRHRARNQEFGNSGLVTRDDKVQSTRRIDLSPLGELRQDFPLPWNKEKVS